MWKGMGRTVGSERKRTGEERKGKEQKGNERKSRKKGEGKRTRWGTGIK